MRKIYLSLLALVCSVGVWAQTLPFKTSTAPAEGVWNANTTWYFIDFPHVDDYHTGGYLAAEGVGFISEADYDGSGDARTSKGKLLITRTEKPIKPSALWCVVGDDTNGYTFYNKMNPYLRLGMPSGLGSARLYGPTDIDGVTYKFLANTATNESYASREDCCTFYIGTNSYWNDMDGGNNDYLACWSNDAAQAVGGSVVRFTQVSTEELAQMAQAVSVPTSDGNGKTYFRIRNLRSSKYAMYNGDASALTQTNDATSLGTMWYATADGDGYYLYNAASSKKYASLSSFTDSGTKMYIKENPYCSGLLCISTSADLGGTSCWDDGGGTSFSGGWTPEKTDYAGTSWSLEEVEMDDISTDKIKEELNARISSLREKYESGTIGMYELSESGETKYNEVISVVQTEMEKDTPDKSVLLTQVGALNALDSQLASGDDYCRVKAPAKGRFYRLKNVASGRYMADFSGNNVMMSDAVDGGENRTATIFYLDAENELLSYSGGCYLDCSAKALAAVGTKYAGTFGFAYGGPTANVVTYKNNSYWTFGNRDNNVSIDRGSSDPNDNGYNWTFEEVSWLPVPMNTTVGYASLYSPVQLSTEGRVKAYAATAVNDDNTSISLEECSNGIPANTGVILEYVSSVDETNGCVFLNVQPSTITGVTSVLQGTLAATNISAPGYVLAKPEESDVALYKAAMSDGSWKNNGFKAYLPASALSTAGGEAPSLTFNFGTETGIGNIESTGNVAGKAVIYDLSGRRVKSAQKGIFIINGKKVVK